MRVAILGAGPAGCAAACELCRLGAAVVLLSDGRNGVGEQIRAVAARWASRLCRDSRRWVAETLRDQPFIFPSLRQRLAARPRGLWIAMRQRAVDAGAVLHEPVRLLALVRSSNWRLSLDRGEVVCD